MTQPGCRSRPERVYPRKLVRRAAALALIAGAFGACSSEPPQGSSEQPEGHMPVSAWPVGSDVLTVRRRWAGTLEPLRVLSVQAPQAGRIESVMVTDGQRVERGEVLAIMTAPETQARRGVLEERRRHLEEQLQRWERLAETQTVGAAEVTEAMLRLLEVHEALVAAQAALDDHVIRAPAPGLVAAVGVDAGAHVSGGQTLLRLEDEQMFGVRVSVPARETGYLEDATNLSVRDLQGRELDIDRIVYSDDGSAGFVRADVFLRNPPPLRGREIELLYEASESALIIPWTAVASDDGRSWVAIITGDPPRVSRREVELGRGHAAGIEVREGLLQGDLVLRFEPRSHPEGRLVEPLRPD